MIVRFDHGEVPLWVDYELTALGSRFLARMVPLWTWSLDYAEGFLARFDGESESGNSQKARQGGGEIRYKFAFEELDLRLRPATIPLQLFDPRACSPHMDTV
ncbi:hypothetical protein ACF6ZU_24515 [Pseudomonas migulae]|uniref:hypothetical protein n=1 Tax=Pseudomonas migulae TaxID=78543 RepID=UPI00371C8C5D